MGFFAFGTLITLNACSNDDEPKSSGTSDNKPDAEMTIYVYPGVGESDGVVPRMTAVYGSDIFVELYDPAHPEEYVYHYMNGMTGESAYMTATSAGMMLIDNNPSNDLRYRPVSLLSFDGNDLVLSLGEYEHSSGEMTIHSSTTVENATKSVDTKSSATGAPSVKSEAIGDDMDFARELVMKDIIRPLSQSIGKADKLLQRWPMTQSARDFLSVFNDVGLVVAEAQLYSNDLDDFTMKSTEKLFVTQVKKIKCVKKTLDTVDKAKRIYRASVACYNEARGFDEENYASVDDDGLRSIISISSDVSRGAMSAGWQVIDESHKYKPKVKLVGVNGQSATVCGSFSNYDGRFTVTGYYLYQGSSMIQQVSANLDGYTNYTFSNLEKGKTYYVTSYATVMGATYESPEVEFTIDGDLELSETSLTFSESGGKGDVEVTLPSSKWTWKASSDSKWCTASTSGNILKVSVSASQSSRQATVTVVATSPKGETQTKTLSVKQQSIGNVAMFKGTCTLTDKTVYSSAPSYNNTYETKLDLFLMLMKIGGSTNLTFTLPVSGLILSNWTVSNTRPTSAAMMEGYSLTSFTCSSTSTLISIDGSTKGPDNGVYNFSVKIDLANLKVKILETGKSSGTGYPGSNPSPYNSTRTLSGTLNYTDEFNY